MAKMRPILEETTQGWLVRAPVGYHLSNADIDDDLPENLDFIFLGRIEKRPREALQKGDE